MLARFPPSRTVHWTCKSKEITFLVSSRQHHDAQSSDSEPTGKRRLFVFEKFELNRKPLPAFRIQTRPFLHVL